MEGVASEAASLAGHLELGKLIVLYDDNKVSLAGADRRDVHRGRRASASRPTAGTRSEIGPEQANDVEAIDRAITRGEIAHRRGRR